MRHTFEHKFFVVKEQQVTNVPIGNLANIHIHKYIFKLVHRISPRWTNPGPAQTKNNLRTVLDSNVQISWDLNFYVRDICVCDMTYTYYSESDETYLVCQPLERRVEVRNLNMSSW